MEKKTQWNVWYAIVAVFAVMSLQQWWAESRQVEVIPYSEFEQLLKRKDIVKVYISDQYLEGQVNYGWESHEFYRNWMGSSEENHPMPEMHGASIDITSPELVSPDGVLALFNTLLNEI